MTDDAFRTRRDVEDAPGRRALLDVMHKMEFIRTLHRAQMQSPGSSDAETLELWAHRLLPYMEREPGLTVAEALKMYNADVQKR